ncbi:hypothetical protein [Lysobacter gummosus]|uniref:hypothetical protein n=1 Tax=Lysobacter gummosus TaxID=262324 RepID=UPI00362D2A53
MSESSGRWVARCGAALCVAVSGAAGATRQCPPGSGEKSTLFWAAGWSVFGLFLLLGLAIVIGAVRATRAQRWTRRVPLLILAAVAMLGSWVLGLFVFVNGFVMVC